MRLAALLALLASAATSARAEVKVGALVGDHMVVQQRKPIRLYGTAAPGETVRASLDRASGNTKADAAGRWELTLPALPAGGPYTLAIGALRFSDVWSGEVWVASGQSNMEFQLAQSTGVAAALAEGCPRLRLFTVAKTTALEPAADVTGAWQACTAETAVAFSAVAFHAGQELQRALGVTVGLVHASWGGTPAEAWTPRAALTRDAALAPMVEEFDRVRADPALRAEVARKTAEWEAKNFYEDMGVAPEAQGWAALDADDAGWATMELPQRWENAGLKIDGAVWFRRTIDVPAGWKGRDLALGLGPVDDFDTTYWNGERVGATGNETPQYWSAPRHYVVPGRLVAAGRNVVAVRVFDHYGDGGFVGVAPQMTLAPAGAAPTSLAGPWRYKVERGLTPAVADFASRPQIMDADNPRSPTVLWNGMIAALTRYPVAGALWYQGEDNASRAYQYRVLFPAMIGAWREAWREPELPFFFVQLPNFMAAPVAPGDSEWAELREAQAMALRLPRTGMAVTLDLGDPDDIHPRNKRDVGVRLARRVLAASYGRGVEAAGPTFRRMAREGAALRVAFDGGPLATSDGAPPRGFAIAGEDRRWRWAEARIDGDSVVVSAAEVPAPVAVRYAWADNPPNTLRNRAGLPAAPFRTDDWPGLTQAPR